MQCWEVHQEVPLEGELLAGYRVPVVYHEMVRVAVPHHRMHEERLLVMVTAEMSIQKQEESAVTTNLIVVEQGGLLACW